MTVFLLIILTILAVSLLIMAALWLDLLCGNRIKRPLIQTGEARRVTGKLHYFTDGRTLFADMQHAAWAAGDHIYLSFYIFKNDEVGRRLLDVLKQRARAGVDVRLLVDRFGGRSLRKLKPELEAAGVSLAFSGRLRFPFTFYFLNRRNHRKIMVLDERIGYFGGFNVSRDYIGNNAEKGVWHDNHLRIDGAGCHFLQQLFLIDWQRATGASLAPQADNTDKPLNEKESLELVATNGGGAEAQFAARLRAARQSIIIGSPYFIPGRTLNTVLLDRLQHGVKITLILPLKRDHAFVRPAAFTYLEPLIKRGAHVYYCYQGFYHSKVWLIDERIGYIGTANFDKRSLFWNDELLGFTSDPSICAAIGNQLARDIDSCILFDSRGLQKRSWIERLKTVCCRPFDNLL
ncbi:MAG: phospholipase D-like domain-containing protein [Sporolactobacillus sp.]